MTNTAKHFTCYSGLIGVALFLFGLYHQVELKYTASEQLRVDSSANTEQLIQNNAKAIAARDAQVAKLNAQLDHEQAISQTNAEQLATVNQLLHLKQPIEVRTVQVPSEQKPGLTPPTPDWVIPAAEAPVLQAKLIDCAKCQNSLVAAQADNAALKQSITSDEALVLAYKVVESKQPHTRFQKFRKGLRWVFSLGS